LVAQAVSAADSAKTIHRVLGLSTANSPRPQRKPLIPEEKQLVQKHVEMMTFFLTKRTFRSIVEKVPRGLLDNKPNGT
jgi:hypothetical protein